MRKRAELLGHIQNTNSQYNLAPFEHRIDRKSNRLGLADRFEEESVRKSVEVDLELIEQYDKMLNDLESYLLQHTKVHSAKNYFLLQTVPGIGKILALVLLYEIQDITRFPRVQDFSSYARLVRPTKTSAGKSYGTSNTKIGNPHLKWAFSEAACLFLRESEQAKRYAHKLESRHGKPKALSILANRIGRSVYFMLKNEEVFEMDKFFKH